MPRYDTAVLNGTVVIPYLGAVRCDIGVRDGRIAALADSIASGDADLVVDAHGMLVFPGAVDSHFHIGIYRDLAADAKSETASALAGGVTTVLSYFRTGQNYLNKSGPYRTIFPEVVAATTGHAYTDFGYHIGVMTTEQLDEVDWLVAAQGVGSTSPPTRRAAAPIRCPTRTTSATSTSSCARWRRRSSTARTAASP